MATRMVGLESGKAEEGGAVMVARARAMQSDLRAAVTAVLPAVKSGRVVSQEDFAYALGAVGVEAGSDRDLALMAGAVQSAQAFVLLAESLGVDPEECWRGYLAESA